MYKKIAIAALALGLIAPAVAQAHVTVQPAEVPAGGFTRLDVRVPNERDDAGTIKVEVQFPDGFHFASYEPVPGWDVEVKMEKLDQPVEDSHGEEVTEQVSRIIWTGDGREGIVPPGAFQDFGLSVQTPDTPDETLTFPALQTYEGGEVVRWIGAPDAEEPAPTVSLTAAEDEQGKRRRSTKRPPSRPRTTTATGSRSPLSWSAASASRSAGRACCATATAHRAYG